MQNEFFIHEWLLNHFEKHKSQSKIQISTPLTDSCITHNIRSNMQPTLQFSSYSSSIKFPSVLFKLTNNSMRNNFSVDVIPDLSKINSQLAVQFIHSANQNTCNVTASTQVQFFEFGITLGKKEPSFTFFIPRLSLSDFFSKIPGNPHFTFESNYSISGNQMFSSTFDFYTLIKRNHFFHQIDINYSNSLPLSLKYMGNISPVQFGIDFNRDSLMLKWRNQKYIELSQKYYNVLIEQAESNFNSYLLLKLKSQYNICGGIKLDYSRRSSYRINNNWLRNLRRNISLNDFSILIEKNVRKKKNVFNYVFGLTSHKLVIGFSYMTDLADFSCKVNLSNYNMGNFRFDDF